MVRKKGRLAALDKWRGVENKQAGLGRPMDLQARDEMERDARLVMAAEGFRGRKPLSAKQAGMTMSRAFGSEDGTVVLNVRIPEKLAIKLTVLRMEWESDLASAVVRLLEDGIVEHLREKPLFATLPREGGER